ncbi:sterile alpha motif domain-containing protein 13 isoform X3 [Lutra lutra]|uniref:sterile alpha motif domain-containing protein 13 isoform X3 n=1 Tax=Lutra lutra TaxID=9657 RepID=UPI001FD058E0|nr:sterile alpha motif domain-containing protein 13 isoform X3 [Lutra lutra]
MRGVAEVKEPCSLPMLSVDMENKENGSVGVKNSMENGRPPDPADWAVMDVVNYFRTAGFEEQASAFQEQAGACAWPPASSRARCSQTSHLSSPSQSPITIPTWI